MEPGALANWQLLKSPTILTDYLDPTHMDFTIRDLELFTAWEAMDVSAFGAIRIQVWGEGTENDVPVIRLNGWQDGGPGHHIGTITLAMGNLASGASDGFHTSEYTHKSIRDAFDPTALIRGCDVYTETADYEGALSVSTLQANMPGFVDVSFANNQYKWLSVLVSDLGTPAAETVGAIFKVLSLKKGYSSPDFTG